MSAGAGPSSERLDVEPDEAGREVADAPVYCPGCGMPAWIEWSTSLGSTGGDVRHVKVRCFQRHWFLMPASYLDEERQSPG